MRSLFQLSMDAQLGSGQYCRIGYRSVLDSMDMHREKYMSAMILKDDNSFWPQLILLQINCVESKSKSCV